MNLPNKSNYPSAYSTEYELKTVVDSLYSRTISPIKPYDPQDSTTYDWENGLGVIDLDDTSLWPDSGYVSIYLEENYGKAIERSCLFHYGSKNINSLNNVTIIERIEFNYFPENSIAVQNIVAQNHNFNKDAILKLEEYLGHRGNNDQSSVEWFTNFYSINVRKPKPWINIWPSKIFIGEYIYIKDLTTRINPGFKSNQDRSVRWIFNLQDIIIEINLDQEQQNYIFTSKYTDENGQQIIKEEIKKEWNREIIFKYTKGGIKNISLFVSNEFGSNNLYLSEAVKVIDIVPKSLDINIYGPYSSDASKKVRCKAIEDQVSVIADLNNFSNLEISSEGYIWDIPNIDLDLIPKTPFLRLNFEYGGNYYVALKVLSKNGSWIGKFIEDAIDVFEKPSVWIGSASNISGNLNLNEYSINSNTWKSNPVHFNLNYAYGTIENTSASESGLNLSFKNSKGFHGKPNTDNAYLIWAPGEKDLNCAKFNALTNIITQEVDNPFIKFYNWYTLYLPIFNDNRIYILGGVTDLFNFSLNNQEISYYDIMTKTLNTVTQQYSQLQNVSLRKINNNLFLTNNNEVITSSNEIVPDFDLSNIDIDSLEFVFPYTSAFSNAQEMVNNPNDYLCKWKSTTYENLGYILRNSSSNILEDLFSFDPSLNVFKTINSKIPFSKYELGFDALNDGIYVISNKGDIYKYNTLMNAWNTTANASSSTYSDNFHDNSIASRNENAPVVTGTESRTINASNTDLYFSYNYSLNSFGKFNSQTVSFQKLNNRPQNDSSQSANDLWDMLKF